MSEETPTPMKPPGWIGEGQKRIALAAAPSGILRGASGSAEVRSRHGRGRFRVSIEADARDGTKFPVFANDRPAGTITLRLGMGELDLDNRVTSLPEGVDPVWAIARVAVTDMFGNVVLAGTF